MKTANNKQIVVNWMKAFNTKDLPALLSLYHDEAQHFSPKLKIAKPETKGLIKGKKELGLWWEDAFKRLPGLHYRLENTIVQEDSVFMEYTRQVPGEADLKVGEVLEIKDGLIVFSRVYHA
ncbi:MAG TPA: nuclear transport factor 2 family protein [Bacteroidia bacterium]|nr:nuclear transport factor 2 family protein [Bacteroidia bacterium]